jgi:hypothetical protein
MEFIFRLRNRAEFVCQTYPVCGHDRKKRPYTSRVERLISMWSRRHFADARPAGVVFLQNLFVHTESSIPAPEPVIDNLAAVTLPARRLAYVRLHPAR